MRVAGTQAVLAFGGLELRDGAGIPASGEVIDETAFHDVCGL
jgi:hypothetical protein